MDKETASILNSEIKHILGKISIPPVQHISARACLNELTKSIEQNIPDKLRNKIKFDLETIMNAWKMRELDFRIIKAAVEIAGQNALRTFLKEV